MSLSSKPGPPGAPSNLTLLLLSVEQSAISWAPPFSLPEVILSYYVEVTNLNTSGVVSSDVLKAPNFNFSGTKNASPCDVYQLTVTARNEAGLSDSSNFIFSLPSCKLKLESMQNVTSHRNVLIEIRKTIHVPH